MLSLVGIGPHGKRVCHTFKLLKGGVSMFLPPKNENDQREQEAQQTQLKLRINQQKPSPLIK